MLNLARAVYPDKEWGDEDGWPCHWPYVNGAPEVFDPSNNSEQFVEVLAWFMSKDNSNELDGAVVRFYPDPDPNSPCRVIEHNGTPADIRRAVVEAAIRVANA